MKLDNTPNCSSLPQGSSSPSHMLGLYGLSLSVHDSHTKQFQNFFYQLYYQQQTYHFLCSSLYLENYYTEDVHPCTLREVTLCYYCLNTVFSPPSLPASSFPPSLPQSRHSKCLLTGSLCPSLNCSCSQCFPRLSGSPSL